MATTVRPITVSLMPKALHRAEKAREELAHALEEAERIGALLPGEGLLAPSK